MKKVAKYGIVILYIFIGILVLAHLRVRLNERCIKTAVKEMDLITKTTKESIKKNLSDRINDANIEKVFCDDYGACDASIVVILPDNKLKIIIYKYLTSPTDIFDGWSFGISTNPNYRTIVINDEIGDKYAYRYPEYDHLMVLMFIRGNFLIRMTYENLPTSKVNSDDKLQFAKDIAKIMDDVIIKSENRWCKFIKLE